MNITICFGLGKSAESRDHGLGRLANTLTQLGHTVTTLKWNGKIWGKPDVLIGHSFGGAQVHKWCVENATVRVPLLVLVDAVPNYWWAWPFVLIGKWKTPSLVGRATAFTQSRQPLPPSRGFHSGLGNNIRVKDVGHDSICDSLIVHAEILRLVALTASERANS